MLGLPAFAKTEIRIKTGRILTTAYDFEVPSSDSFMLDTNGTARFGGK